MRPSPLVPTAASRRLGPPRFTAAARRVRVPATSANLGSGFDAFGLAVDLHDDLLVTATEAGLRVDVDGEGAAALRRDAKHLVVRSMHAAFDAMGGRPPGLALACTNRIPHGRGLGSSAAAVVAGIVAARALVEDGRERLDDEAVLRLATEVEGHPDNVAACLLGGFTLAWTAADGPHAVRLDPSGDVVAVAFVPSTALATAKARRLLPESVPHADAAHAAGRAALLVEALTRRPELLLAATEDRLHQGYRASAMPAGAALISALRDRGVAAVVSGAGPTVLALVLRGQGQQVAALGGSDFAASVLELEARGATAEPFA